MTPARDEAEQRSSPSFWDRLRERLQAISDDEELIHDWPNDAPEDVPVRQVAAPGDSNCLLSVLVEASSSSAPVYPLGGCTSLDFGRPANREGLGLDLSRMNRVVDYPARDMTITVEAGISVRLLQKMLAEKGQRLPVDVPEADRATLGGALVTNTSGPRRYGFGTLRDYVIGISAVDGEGTPFKAGGRVVKNVAGYDLCKLLVGSLGTLGVVTQVTLKVRPQSETTALVGSVVPAESGRVDRLLAGLGTSRTRPVAIELLNDRAAGHVAADLGQPSWMPCLSTAERLLLVGFEGSDAEVGWQREQISKEWNREGLQPWEQLGADAEPLWRALAEYQTRTAALSFKANLLGSRVVDFFRACDDRPIALAAHAGNGIVVGHLSEVDDAEAAEDHLQPLRAQAVKSQGNLVVLRCPAPWKRVIPVWGEPRGDWALMQRIRETLDPAGILNPGRFLWESAAT